MRGQPVVAADEIAGRRARVIAAARGEAGAVVLDVRSAAEGIATVHAMFR